MIKISFWIFTQSHRVTYRWYTFMLQTLYTTLLQNISLTTGHLISFNFDSNTLKLHFHLYLEGWNLWAISDFRICKNSLRSVLALRTTCDNSLQYHSAHMCSVNSLGQLAMFLTLACPMTQLGSWGDHKNQGTEFF